MNPLISLIIGTLCLLYICDVRHEHVERRYYIATEVWVMQMYCETTDKWIVNGEHYEMD